METAPAFVGDSPLKFGTKVRNKITGDEGIVVSKFYLLSGCMQVMVKSQTLRNKDNHCINHYATFDQLEVLEGGHVEFGAQPKEESAFRLGEKVKVPAYGLTGIVHSIGFFPDQATHLEVQPPYNEREGKLPACVSVAEALVESLEQRPKAQTAAASRPSPPQPGSQPPAQPSRE